MNASKENAAKARGLFLTVLTPSMGDVATSPEEDRRVEDAAQFVDEFLLAAERKLPSEAAYTKEH